MEPLRSRFEFDATGFKVGMDDAAAQAEKRAAQMKAMFADLASAELKAAQAAQEAGKLRAEAMKGDTESAAKYGEALKALAEKQKELAEVQEKISRTSETQDVWGRFFKNILHPFKEGDWQEVSNSVGEMVSHPFRTAGAAARDFLTEIGPMGAISIGAALGLAELGKQAFELVNEEGMAARQTQNFANMLNLSYEETKHLGEMARIVDADIGGLARASYRLADALSGTGTNKQAEDALAKLKINATDSGEALMQVLQRLSEMPDKTERTRLAYETLGRASYQLMPLIENFDRLKTTVSELDRGIDPQGLIAARERVNELSLAWSELKEALAAKLSPVIEVVVRAVKEVVSPSAEPAFDKRHDTFLEAAGVGGVNPMSVEGAAANATAAAARLMAGAADKGLQAAQKQGQILMVAADTFHKHYSASVEGLKKALEDATTRQKELLPRLLKPESFSRADAAEYGRLEKTISTLKQQVKAAEEAESGRSGAQRAEIAEKRIEDEKKIGLLRIEIANDAAKADYELNKSRANALQDYYQAQIAHESQRADLEISSARRVNEEKQRAARAEHKPATGLINIQELELEHERRLAEIRNREAAEEEKQEDDRIRKHIEDLNAEMKFEETVQEHVRRLNEQLEESRKRAAEVTAQAEMSHAQRVYERNKALVEADYQQHRIGAERRLELLKQIELQEYKTQMAGAVAEYNKAVSSEKTGGDPEAVAKAQAKIQEISDRYNQAMDQLRAKSQTLLGVMRETLQGMNDLFVNSIAGWNHGQEGFFKAFGRSLNAMESSLAASLARQAIQWLEHLAMKKAAQLGFDSLLTALHITHAATSKAIDSAKNVAEVTGAASVGAANAGASIAAIPIVGPAMVAPTAAATFAQLISFAPMSSFEHGGVVPETGIAQVHKNEMYLGTGLSDFIRSSVSSYAGKGEQSGPQYHFHQAPGTSPNDVSAGAAAFKRAMRDGRVRV